MDLFILEIDSPSTKLSGEMLKIDFVEQYTLFVFSKVSVDIELITVVGAATIDPTWYECTAAHLGFKYL